MLRVNNTLLLIKISEASKYILKEYDLTWELVREPVVLKGKELVVMGRCKR